MTNKKLLKAVEGRGHDRRPRYNRAMVKQLKEADAAEPEGTFDNVEDMMQWLNASSDIKSEDRS